MRHLIDILDFSVEEIDKLCATANDIIANPEMYSESCKGKKGTVAKVEKTAKKTPPPAMEEELLMFIQEEGGLLLLPTFALIIKL